LDEPVLEVNDEHEQEQLNAASEEISAKLAEQEKEHKNIQKTWKVDIKKQEEQLVNFKQQIKEKQKENKISKLKVQ
jgi:hypothetical protein